MKRLLCVLSAVFMLCSCTEQIKPQPEPVYECVYSDEMVMIEARELVRVDLQDSETDLCCLRIRLTNLSQKNIVLSSLMCFAVSSGGEECQIEDTIKMHETAKEFIADFRSADGLIAPTESLECYICFRAKKDAVSFIVDAASDYSNGKWVSFEYVQTQ